MSQIRFIPFLIAQTCQKLVPTTSKVPKVVQNQIQPLPKCTDLPLISFNPFQSALVFSKSTLPPKWPYMTQIRFKPFQSARTYPKLRPLRCVQICPESDLSTPKCSKLPKVICNSLKSARPCPKLILPASKCTYWFQIHYYPFLSARACP